MWLYNEAYQDERLKAAHAKAAGGSSGGAKTYPREKQDYEGQVCEAQQHSARGVLQQGVSGGVVPMQLLVGLRRGRGTQQTSLVPSIAWLGLGQGSSGPSTRPVWLAGQQQQPRRNPLCLCALRCGLS